MDNNNYDPKFCIHCGSDLTMIKYDGRYRFKCPTCEWIYYPQLKVSSAAQITDGNRLLLVKRAFDPWKNFWYMPAGYVESDESPIDAVIREVSEETKLDIKVNELLDVYYFDDDPRGNGILIVYTCEIINGKPSKTDEANDIGYFSTDKLPTLIAGAGHLRAVQKWKNIYSNDD